MRNNAKAGIRGDVQDYLDIDPSENVKALSEAANKRQDDLRMATDALFDAKLHGVKELMQARHQCAEALSKAEARRIDEQAALRDSYNERLVTAEAKRIDAIRAIDVNAVAVASQRQSDQAQVLATQLVSSAEQLRTQVAASAEALRVLVAANANTLANAQQQFSTQISDRLTKLEQAQYEGKGRMSYIDPQTTQVSDRLTKLEQAQYEGKGRALYTDPQTAELLLKVNQLSELSRTSIGAASGSASSWTTFVAIIGMIGVAASIGVTLLLSGRNSPPPAPQVIYVPAPAGATLPTTPPTTTAPAPRP